MKHLFTKIGLSLLLLLLFLPLYWMIEGSFQDISGFIKMPPAFIPLQVTLSNYKYFISMNTAVWLKNTVIVVFATVFLSTFVSITAGYAFSQYTFKFKKQLWVILLIGMMIPRISLIIPWYTIIKKLNMQGELSAVIFPLVFSPINMYLARNYFDTIPKSLIESARIDGASEFQILRLIVVPISKPLVATLALFSGIASLQDYIWQMLVLQDAEKQTLLVGLMRLAMFRQNADSYVNPIGKAFAASVLLLFPLVMIFLLANKYFIENLAGAVKE